MFCVGAFASPIKPCHPMFSRYLVLLVAAAAAALSTGRGSRGMWSERLTGGEEQASAGLIVMDARRVCIHAVCFAVSSVVVDMRSGLVGQI